MSKKNQAEKEYKYVCFEACLIPIVDKQINEVFNYAIVKYSTENITLSQDEVIDETIRLFYDDKLPSNIHADLEDAFGFYDSSFRGYNSAGEFDPQEEREGILTYFEEDEDAVFDKDSLSDFISKCRPYCQINRGLHSLKLSGGDYQGMIKHHEKLKKSISYQEFTQGKSPLVMMKIEMILDFVHQEKSFRDFELLKAFLAIKSIQGNKDFAGTNKAMICARMIGAKTPELSKDLIKDKAVKKTFLKYQARYFFDQLLIELQVKSFILAKISYGRSIYLSTQLDKELLCVAIMNFSEKKRLNTASIKLKQEEKEFRLRIANNLKNNILH